MFERMSASFALAQSSWQVLRQDKQLLIFPLLSGIGCFFVLLGFLVPLALFPQFLGIQGGLANADQAQPSPVLWGLAFVYYFCSYFVVIFFNSALISCALLRFHGETPTVADGLRAASSRMPQILAWSLVSATVGMLLKAIENAHEKAGQIISAILGPGWSVMTYFVVPILVVEKVGPIDAVRRSMALLRKTWGEALIGQMGLGLFIFLLSLPTIVLFVLAMLAANTSMVLAAVLGLLGVVYATSIAAISAALHGIFLGAMYHYAAVGDVPDGFDGRSLKSAFQPKR